MSGRPPPARCRTSAAATLDGRRGPRPRLPRAGCGSCRRWGLRRAGALAWVWAACLAAAPLAGQTAGEAERLYREARYEEAYEAFRRLEEEERAPGPALAYDTGNALYRLGRYPEAGGSYARALGAGSPVRQRASYNLGNAFYQAAQGQPQARDALRRAVAAYEEALVLEPGDADAKWNLELALRKLEEEERRESRSGGGGGGGAGSDSTRPGGPGGEGAGGRRNAEAPPGAPESRRAAGQGRPEEAEGGDGRLTEAQARQLVEAVRGEEAEALQAREGAPVREGSGRLDW